MLDLGKIREEIDEVDKQIVSLIQQRISLASDVAEYKMENNKPVLDKNRENEKIATLTQMTDNDFNEHAIKEIFTQMMSISRKYQYKLMVKNGITPNMEFEQVDNIIKEDKSIKVVYQGVPGAYSYAAMLSFFGDDIDNFNVPTWKEAMDKIYNGQADYAVLPIENSTAGMVGDVYDLLVEYENYIVAETAININHALLGIKGSTIGDIRNVYSHPQALMQCGSFLDAHKNWERISTSNTAVSAKKVIELGNKSNAAIASQTAAKLYGLDILKENLNTVSDNATKFIIVSKDKIYKKDSNKVLVTFEIEHESGSLYDILSHFIFNNINLTKIESRPIKGEKWKYRFFVEMEGKITESRMINALLGIKSEALDMQILGCY